MRKLIYNKSTRTFSNPEDYVVFAYGSYSRSPQVSGGIIKVRDLDRYGSPSMSGNIKAQLESYIWETKIDPKEWDRLDYHLKYRTTKSGDKSQIDNIIKEFEDQLRGPH